MFPLSDQATAAGIGNPPQGAENRVAVRDCHGAATVLRPNPFGRAATCERENGLQSLDTTQ